MVVLVLLQQKWSDLVVWLGFDMGTSFGPFLSKPKPKCLEQIFARNFIIPITLEQSQTYIGTKKWVKTGKQPTLC